MKIARMILVCFRNNSIPDKYQGKVLALTNKLIPRIINPKPTLLHKVDSGLIYAVFNPPEGVSYTASGSIYLGKLFEKENGWQDPGGSRPDGSYVLFRSDDIRVEIVTDALASRSVWYYLDSEVFIASTSQRAIVSLLGSLDFNSSAVTWLLSSGHLGPAESWDTRLRKVSGDKSIRLERKKWLLEEIDEGDVIIKPLAVSEEVHCKQLERVIKETFENIDLDYSRWPVALSGGVDSRGLVAMLHGKRNLRTITWGMKGCRGKKYNDASIAREVANYYKLDNDYYEIDPGGIKVEKVFSRFVLYGEGRSDNLAAYVDGFRMWKQVYDDGITGIIRGDIGFGRPPILRERFRVMSSFPLWEDYINLLDKREFGFTEQKMPDDFEKKDYESVPAWHDRIHHQYRIPSFLSALNDLKLPFIEIINPYLSGRIINQVRKMPDHMRIEKKMFKNIIDALNIPVDYATEGATVNINFYLRKKNVYVFLMDMLKSEMARRVFPENYLIYLADRMQVGDRRIPAPNKFNKRLRSYVPDCFKSVFRKKELKLKMDFNLLAFRTYMVARIYDCLKEDCGNR